MSRNYFILFTLIQGVMEAICYEDKNLKSETDKI